MSRFLSNNFLRSDSIKGLPVPPYHCPWTSFATLRGEYPLRVKSSSSDRFSAMSCVIWYEHVFESGFCGIHFFSFLSHSRWSPVCHNFHHLSPVILPVPIYRHEPKLDFASASSTT